jgi:hypothetical protein
MKALLVFAAILAAAGFPASAGFGAFELPAWETTKGSSPSMSTSKPDRFSQVRRDETLPPPRDPELAVREEYELARKNAEALALFIARHADHPLAVEARRELEQLKRTDRR